MLLHRYVYIIFCSYRLLALLYCFQISQIRTVATYNNVERFEEPFITLKEKRIRRRRFSPTCQRITFLTFIGTLFSMLLLDFNAITIKHTTVREDQYHQLKIVTQSNVPRKMYGLGDSVLGRFGVTGLVYLNEKVIYHSSKDFFNMEYYFPWMSRYFSKDKTTENYLLNKHNILNYFPVKQEDKPYNHALKLTMKRLGIPVDLAQFDFEDAKLVKRLFYNRNNNLFFLYYNKGYIDEVIEATQIALSRYFKKPPKSLLAEFSNSCSIALPFRCGDTLIQKKAQYYIAYPYYFNSIHKLLKRYNRVSCLQKSNNQHIYLSTQISLKGAHNDHDLLALPHCRKLVNIFVTKLKKDFPTYQVKVFDESLIKSYALFATIPFAVTYRSGFSKAGALGNPFKKVVIYINETLMNINYTNGFEDIVPPEHIIENEETTKIYQLSTCLKQRQQDMVMPHIISCLFDWPNDSNLTNYTQNQIN